MRKIRRSIMRYEAGNNWYFNSMWRRAQNKKYGREMSELFVRAGTGRTRGQRSIMRRLTYDAQRIARESY